MHPLLMQPGILQKEVKHSRSCFVQIFLELIPFSEFVSKFRDLSLTVPSAAEGDERAVM